MYPYRYMLVLFIRSLRFSSDYFGLEHSSLHLTGRIDDTIIPYAV
jgi:hypothetical protein